MYVCHTIFYTMKYGDLCSTVICSHNCYICLPYLQLFFSDFLFSPRIKIYKKQTSEYTVWMHYIHVQVSLIGSERSCLELYTYSTKPSGIIPHAFTSIKPQKTVQPPGVSNNQHEYITSFLLCSDVNNKAYSPEADRQWAGMVTSNLQPCAPSVRNNTKTKKEYNIDK